MKISANERVCVVCKNTCYSSGDTCYKCRDYQNRREELGIDKMSQEELLSTLKDLFDEQEKEQMYQLSLLFSIGNKFLSSDFILGALITNLECELDEGDIEEQMLDSAKEAMELLQLLHRNWYGW